MSTMFRCIIWRQYTIRRIGLIVDPRWATSVIERDLGDLQLHVDLMTGGSTGYLLHDVYIFAGVTHAH